MIESSVLVRDFLSSADVLEMRTTGLKWNVAQLYGPIAELFFFLLGKDDQDKSVLRPEWPRLQLGYETIFMDSTPASSIQTCIGGSQHALREAALCGTKIVKSRVNGKVHETAVLTVGL